MVEGIGQALDDAFKGCLFMVVILVLAVAILAYNIGSCAAKRPPVDKQAQAWEQYLEQRDAQKRTQN